MTTTPTTNYGFNKITAGTEKDIWGPIQSTTLDNIDTQIKNRQNEAAAALPKAGGTMTGKETLVASAAGGAGLNYPPGAAPTSPNTGDIWTTTLNLVVRLNSLSQNVITDQFATFLARVVTPASVAGAASLNVPHGAAPTAPVNGDVWSTSAGFFFRYNGITLDLVGALAGKAATTHTHVESDVTNLVTDLAAKAPLASPALTGTPTAPTAAPGTNTTQLATTAFVVAAIASGTASPGINTQTASYTLALTDQGKLVEMNVASANTLTVPLNSSVAFPLYTKIDIAQLGAGQTTIVATGGVTLRASGGKLKLSAQYSGATLEKRGTDEWWVWGDLSA